MKKRILTFICVLALFLTGCGGGSGESEPSPEGDGGAEYTITVTDQNGDPVAGAVVNICTDTTCEPQTADENGFIYYIGELKDYHLEVIRVPEGYEIGEEADIYTGESTEISLQVVRE